MVHPLLLFLLLLTLLPLLMLIRLAVESQPGPPQPAAAPAGQDVAGWTSLASDAASPCEYAIVVSESTAARWPSVLTALLQKHGTRRGAQVVSYNYPSLAASAGALAPGGALAARLRALRPALRYVCFVAHWAEAGEAYVRAVHKLSRGLDRSHVFSDVMWGVITGSDEEGARALAAEAEPLTISNVVSGTVEGCDLSRFESGLSFDELVQYAGQAKAAPGADVVETTHEGQDSALLIAAAIEGAAESGPPQMLITSGRRHRHRGTGTGRA